MPGSHSACDTQGTSTSDEVSWMDGASKVHLPPVCLTSSKPIQLSVELLDLFLKTTDLSVDPDELQRELTALLLPHSHILLSQIRRAERRGDIKLIAAHVCSKMLLEKEIKAGKDDFGGSGSLSSERKTIYNPFVRKLDRAQGRIWFVGAKYLSAFASCLVVFRPSLSPFEHFPVLVRYLCRRKNDR